jgi:hypothetical protein
MSAIKGIAIGICGDCLAKVDRERDTLKTTPKKRKANND